MAIKQRTCPEAIENASDGRERRLPSRVLGLALGIRAICVSVIAMIVMIGWSAEQANGQAVRRPPKPTKSTQPLSERAPAPLPPGAGQIYSLKPIKTVKADIRPNEGKLPKNHAAFAFSQPAKAPIEDKLGWKPFHWEAPATSHRPLYFENINLERHGYSFGIAQPLVSAGHFAGSTVILPYRMIAEPACEPVYTLGHVRPGTPTPFQIHWPPPSALSGVGEAALIVGLICAIP